jgi:hypothetical protein
MSGAFIPPSQGGGGVEVDDRADVIAPQAAGIVVAPVAGQRRVGRAGCKRQDFCHGLGSQGANRRLDDAAAVRAASARPLCDSDGHEPVVTAESEQRSVRVDVHGGVRLGLLCRWCGKSETAEPATNAWLHAECWAARYRTRRTDAVKALATIGIPSSVDKRGA